MKYYFKYVKLYYIRKKRCITFMLRNIVLLCKALLHLFMLYLCLSYLIGVIKSLMAKS